MLPVGHPVHDGGTLLLKTTYALATEHGDIKLELTREIPPRWLAFIELKSAVRGVGEEKSPTVLPKHASDNNNWNVRIRQWLQG